MQTSGNHFPNEHQQQESGASHAATMSDEKQPSWTESARTTARCFRCGFPGVAGAVPVWRTG
ncbi:hypothetical protein [Photorhabdus heterorhabditis]|uniref:hypothetical protein n=1 Tax=Photorhabdus heterorhabditis TaxID=880156 RepID=UPI001F28CC89|nr:hypothetical protein [Photorhabdus heterorhabditis]